jgi:hypothetical protein
MNSGTFLEMLPLLKSYVSKSYKYFNITSASILPLIISEEINSLKDYSSGIDRGIKWNSFNHKKFNGCC